jgi:UDP-N-acetylglucosamine 4-epimerase
VSQFEETKAALMASPKTWAVTGVAGFIGSHLLETLLQLKQKVIGLDNLSTGHASNLAEVESAVGSDLWENFQWIEGDIQNFSTCEKFVQRADYVLHQAAIGSVPRSLANPLETNANNDTGFVNMLWAAQQAKVKRFVYASSSSVYGDGTVFPQVEDAIGNCLSPYAVSKRVNELYADVFARCYGMQTIGLRYFNVFGPRQYPSGPYAAVIPKWIAAMIANQPVQINGDGTTTRDFCYVANVVQANILAAVAKNPDSVNHVYNIALGCETTLATLFQMLKDKLSPAMPQVRDFKPIHRPFQPGDVRHSRADTSKASQFLGYQPTHDLDAGLDESMSWYLDKVVVSPSS